MELHFACLSKIPLSTSILGGPPNPPPKHGSHKFSFLFFHCLFLSSSSSLSRPSPRILTPVSDWGTPLAPGWHESRILRSSTNSSTASSSTSPHPPCVQERWIRSSRRRWGPPRTPPTCSRGRGWRPPAHTRPTSGPRSHTPPGEWTPTALRSSAPKRSDHGERGDLITAEPVVGSTAPHGAPPRRAPRQPGPRTPSGLRHTGTTRRWWRRSRRTRTRAASSLSSSY